MCLSLIIQEKIYSLLDCKKGCRAGICKLSCDDWLHILSNIDFDKVELKEIINYFGHHRILNTDIISMLLKYDLDLKTYMRLYHCYRMRSKTPEKFWSNFIKLKEYKYYRRFYKTLLKNDNFIKSIFNYISQSKDEKSAEFRHLLSLYKENINIDSLTNNYCEYFLKKQLKNSNSLCKCNNLFYLEIRNCLDWGTISKYIYKEEANSSLHIKNNIKLFIEANIDYIEVKNNKR